MNERKCEYRIIAFVDGKRIDIECNKETGCLSELVWGGKGVKKAATIALGRPNSEGVEACVEGACFKEVATNSRI